MQQPPKLIAHIIYRLDYGGLENGLVNLVNRMSGNKFHHAIICMTEYSDFAERITNPDVTLHSLHKGEGKDFGVYFRLWRLLRRLKPDIVHTRNLAALEAAVVSWLAGVPCRIHGEHGRDSYDIDGTNKKYLALRKVCKPFIHRFVPLSQDLEEWLKVMVGVKGEKIHQIYNGVDSDRFNAVTGDRHSLPAESVIRNEHYVIGTVGRIQEVKDQLTLIRAFSRLIATKSEYRNKLRLAVIGDGPMMAEVKSLVSDLDMTDLVWLPGSRNDIPELMHGMDLFVLPSKAEGISNTILEAMSCGLPVVATSVGGNPELVIVGETGQLVPAEDSKALSDAISKYADNKGLSMRHGKAGRTRVEKMFSMDAMVSNYVALYEGVNSNRIL